MGQTIVVNVPHKLGKTEAKRRIQEGLGAMQQLEVGGLPGVLSLEKRWDGNQFHLKGRWSWPEDVGGARNSRRFGQSQYRRSQHVGSACRIHQSCRNERNGQG